MTNDEYPPNRFDPLKEGTLFNAIGYWAMVPPFTFPLQVPDRLPMQEERHPRQDCRDERLVRGAYLLIVGIERAIRAVVSLVSRVGSYAATRLLPRGASAQPQASRPRL